MVAWSANVRKMSWGLSTTRLQDQVSITPAITCYLSDSPFPKRANEGPEGCRQLSMAGQDNTWRIICVSGRKRLNSWLHAMARSSHRWASAGGHSDAALQTLVALEALETASSTQPRSVLALLDSSAGLPVRASSITIPYGKREGKREGSIKAPQVQPPLYLCLHN